MNSSSQLNSPYKEQIIQAEMRKTFVDTTPNKISIPNILSKKIYEELEQSLQSQQPEKMKIPDRYSFSSLQATKETIQLFQSDEVLDLIEHITGKRIKNISLTIKKYTHRDYTLLHEDKNPQEKTEFFLVIAPKSWQNAWGGNKIYRDTNGNAVIFTPAPNTLNIIQKSSHDNSFIQYINHLATNQSIIYIEGTLTINKLETPHDELTSRTFSS